MGILTQIQKLFADWRDRIALIVAFAPLLGDLLVAGPAAFATFKKQAPEADQHLQELADALKKNAEGENAPPATPPQVAAVAAHVIGVDPPGWTDAETQRWWDNATGNIGG